MKVRRAILCLLFILLVCATGWAQELRQETAAPNISALAKLAIERHLQSKHPAVPIDPKQPIPGKYLLERSAARKLKLQSRIAATNANGPTLAATSATQTSQSFPGIQLRGSIPAGDIANAVVTGDFNQDGKADFVVANGGTNDLWIYFGKGDGTFQLPRVIPLTKGLTPVSLATADLRGTGVLDLVVAEFDSATVGVLLGNGDGTFGIESEYALPQPPQALAVDDFNHDGKLDIIALMDTVNTPTTFGVPYLATLLGNGTGSFGNPTITNNPGFYSSAQSIVSGDVNGDGLPDVLITGPLLENSQIYLNTGGGTFTPGQTVLENSPTNAFFAGQLADVNGDGCLDAIVADGNGFVWISDGDCHGNFAFAAGVPMGDSNDSLSVVDINGDGNRDIVTTTFPLLLGQGLGDVAGNMLTVSFGDGKGNFTSGRDYVGTGMSYSLAIADFNHDGHPDVISASPDTNTATVWINDGSGGFGFPQGEWIGFHGSINNPLSPPTFADANGDGKPDVVVLNEGYNGEYLITTMLNDGTGKFAAPLISDAGASIVKNWIGDYRLGDFRNTGHQDFLGIGLSLNLSEGSQFVLFAPGNGDGTFGQSTLTVLPGSDVDFNRDGKLDFAAVGSAPTGTGWMISIYLGNGDGTFRAAGTIPFDDSSTPNGSIGRLFVGDFNHDGKLDILVFDTANGYWTPSSYVWEFLGNGDGTFQTGRQLFSAFQPMTMADVNGDSWPDIVRYDTMWPDGTTQTLGPSRFTTYLGQPSGVFSQSSSYAPYQGVPLEVDRYQFGDPSTSSMVADMNGDGKPDELAFQTVGDEPGDAYMQILAGNGDGTLTPTYDVFDFQKQYYVPRFARVLDTSAISDLIEIDGATSLMSVFKGGNAPSLQMQLEDNQIIGNSGCGWVFLNTPSGAATTILLSTSVAGVNPPGSVTIPAGSLSQQFCFSVDATYDWHQVFDIRAQLGSDTAVAYGSQAYLFGFTEAISPSTDEYVYAGQSTSPITISLTAFQGYSSTAQLSCQGLPAGATCTFASPSLNISPNNVATTTVVINTSATDVTYGDADVVVVASDSELTARQSFTLHVRSLVVQGGGNLGQITSPGSLTADLQIFGIPPYSGSCVGLPAAFTCSLVFGQNTNPNFQTDLMVSLTVPAGVAGGSYPFSIQIMSGSVVQSVALSVNIADFSLQPPVGSSAWGPPGGTVSIDLSIQSIANFQQVVSVTCSLNAGATCQGGSLPIASGVASAPFSVSVSLPLSAPLGVQSLTVTATSGQLSHSITFPFYVADYSGTLSASALTIQGGGNGSITATVNATTGFGGPVLFSCTGTPIITCSFSPQMLQPNGTSAQTTNITISASESAFVTPIRRSPAGRLVFLTLILSFGFVIGGVRNRQLGTRIATGFLFVLLLAAWSCAGGGVGSGTNGSAGGAGTGGASTYAVTVGATVKGTNTMRTLGTVNVTVKN